MTLEVQIEGVCDLIGKVIAVCEGGGVGDIEAGSTARTATEESSGREKKL